MSSRSCMRAPLRLLNAAPLRASYKQFGRDESQDTDPMRLVDEVAASSSLFTDTFKVGTKIADTSSQILLIPTASESSTTGRVARFDSTPRGEGSAGWASAC